MSEHLVTDKEVYESIITNMVSTKLRVDIDKIRRIVFKYKSGSSQSGNIYEEIRIEHPASNYQVKISDFYVEADI